LGSLYKYYYYYYYEVAIKFYYFYLCIIFLQLGLLDDAITHTKDILQKGIANSKVLEFFFFFFFFFVFNGNGCVLLHFALQSFYIAILARKARFR